MLTSSGGTGVENPIQLDKRPSVSSVRDSGNLVSLASECGSIRVLSGRPNVRDIISTAQEEVNRATGCDRREVAVLTCGPARMVSCVEGICQDNKYYFHKETFAL